MTLKELPAFSMADPKNTPNGWTIKLQQQTRGASVYLTNQTYTAFSVFGVSGVGNDFLGDLFPGGNYIEFVLKGAIYLALELVPFPLSPQSGSISLFVSGILKETTEQIQIPDELVLSRYPQDRSVTMPAPPGASHDDKTSITATGVKVLSQAPMSTSILPRNEWANTLAFYLYSFTAQADSGGEFFIEAELWMVQRNVVPAIISSFPIAWVVLQAQRVITTGSVGPIGTSLPYVYTPAAPYVFSFVPLAATVEVALAWNIVVFQSDTGTVSLFDSWQATVDAFSNGSIPSVGQGSGVLSGGIF